jgi:DNA-directed RNA polymerase subunit RPC12/RpoP
MIQSGMRRAVPDAIACTECGARLTVVRIKAQPMTSDRAPCPNCGSFLLPRDGDDLLSYRKTPSPTGQVAKKG